MREVYDSINVKFEELEQIELDLSNSFKNFNFYFSDYNKPKIISILKN